MSLNRIELIGKEPLSLQEVKQFLKIDFDAEDVLLVNFITTARSVIESYTSRALLLQKWRFIINANYAVAKSNTTYINNDNTVHNKGISIPKAPFIKLFRQPMLINNNNFIPITDFNIDDTCSIAKLYIHSLHSANLSLDSKVQLEFIVGYNDNNIPEQLKHAILVLVARLYENRTLLEQQPYLASNMPDNITKLIRPYQVKRLA